MNWFSRARRVFSHKIMKTRSSALLAAIVLVAGTTTSQSADWPAWRGDLAGSGATSEKSLPLEWGKEKNVRWRVPLPERGNSTPIVLGDRIFVTQAIDSDHFRGLLCFNRKDGSLLWKKGVTYDKPERTHRTNPYCSASPTTDGERVVASYGSAGLACYDLDGKEVWKRDFGAIDHVWGNSSSPVLYKDVCIHYHGPGKGGFLIALDKKTGKTVWKFDEPDWKPGDRTDGFRGRSDEGVIGSFSTPIIIGANGRDELVMSFPMEVKAFDPLKGDVLWTCGGLNPLVYTSPVHGDGIVVALGGYYGNSVGVKAGGKGEITESNRVWHEVRHHGGIGSGVVKDGHLYFQNAGGIAFCLELKTGREKWKERLPGKGKSWGSFLLAGGHIYTLSQPGDSVVFKANPEKFEVVAQSDIGEVTNSSLVPSNGEIFIRTHEALWCISASK